MHGIDSLEPFLGSCNFLLLGFVVFVAENGLVLATGSRRIWSIRSAWCLQIRQVRRWSQVFLIVWAVWLNEVSVLVQYADWHLGESTDLALTTASHFLSSDLATLSTCD